MIRILFILPSLNVGGLERVQVTLANALVRNGYDVTVMTLGVGDELRGELDERVHFVYKPLKPHPLMQRIPYIRHKFYDDGMWETRASARELHDYYVGDEHFDVEIAFFRGMPIKIVSGCPFRGDTDFEEKSLGTQRECTTISRKSVRTLAWVHTDFEKATGYQNNFKSMRDVFEAYRSFDHVVCVSEQAKAGFIKTIGDTGNLVTVYNMLPVEEICRKAELPPEIAVKKAAFHMVLVGRLLDSAKGQKRLIDVTARLHREGYDVSLCLVGGGADEEMLRSEITALGAESYITMTGSQMNPYPYIKEADLLVCASYFEGYNLTVAEALILGTPVLSTDCTGPNEILDHGKYGMITENSTEGLDSGIRTLLMNPGVYNDLRKRALVRREFFDESYLLNSICALFWNQEKEI